MPTYSDNLDGTSGDLLRSRSGWSRALGTDDVVITTAGSGVTLTDGATAANGTWHVPTSQPSGNDQFAEGLLKIGIAGGQRPLCVRANIASALGVTYSARRNTSSQVLIHRRSAAGAFTQLGSYTVTPSTDFDTKKVRLEAVGNQITLYFGGTAVIGPVTDNNIASGSVAILTAGGSYTNTNNVLDDYAWGDVGAATHDATGALTGQIGAVAGSAAHIAIHAATGALAGPGSTVAGSADHPATGAHVATGALTGQGSAVAGSSARTRIFSATGVLTGQGSAIAGVAALKLTHATSGALAGLQAAIAGSAALVPLTGDILVSGGAQTGGLTVTGGSRSGGLTVTGAAWS